MDSTVRREESERGIVVVRFGSPADPATQLGLGLLSELVAELEKAAGEAATRGIVVLPEDGCEFCAGTDPRVILDLDTLHDGADLARDAQRAASRIEALRVPVVAALRGRTFDMGLELALACRARVASLETSTRLGAPGMGIGLLPCAGSTRRLPALIGLEAACELWLDAERVEPRRALELGLVNAIAHHSEVLAVAVRVALELATPHKRVARRSWLGLAARYVDQRRALAAASRRVAAARHGRAHARWSSVRLAAAERLLHALDSTLSGNVQRAHEAERQAFGEQVTSSGFQQAFRARCAETRVTAAASEPRLRNVAVLGASAEARELVRALVLCGLRVCWVEPNATSLGQAMRCLREELELATREHALERTEADLALAQASAAHEVVAARRADLVLETWESSRREEKRAALSLLATAPEGPPCATLLGAGTLAALSVPAGVAGFRQVMLSGEPGLIEVTRGLSSERSERALEELAQRLQRVCILATDSPGGLSVRLAAAVLTEALRLLGDGVPAATIEFQLREFGFVVSPFEIAAQTGLESWARMLRELDLSLGERFAPTSMLGAWSAAQRLGWPMATELAQRGAVARAALSRLVLVGRPLEPGEAVQRCVLRVVNEAALLFGEGRGSPAEIDRAAVLGAAFPIEHGGPLRFVATVGGREILRRLEALAARVGERFEPAPFLMEHARGARSIPFDERSC
jgi:3-hydroxyacyl-CoA dehydrogenase/enoyl-CoA hydratase/3-hydroxybutyryl-CoA epimerase